jgi:UrcA family protein
MLQARPLRLLGALSLLTALTAAAPMAHAQAPGEANTRVVRYGDLDLTTRRGAHALYVRLREAARSVCGEVPFSPFPSPEIKACVDHAIGSAVTKIDRPALTDYYAERVRHNTPRSLFASGH